MDETGGGSDLGTCASSDKKRKQFWFNSALSCLLSECALKVFSRRDPSKLKNIDGQPNIAVQLPNPGPTKENLSQVQCRFIDAAIGMAIDSSSQSCVS
jgi:hypothetical protein